MVNGPGMQKLGQERNSGSGEARVYSELVQAVMGRTLVGPCSHQQGSQLPHLQYPTASRWERDDTIIFYKKETAMTLRSES